MHRSLVKTAPYSTVAVSEIKNRTSCGADNSTAANRITEMANPAASENRTALSIRFRFPEA